MDNPGFSLSGDQIKVNGNDFSEYFTVLNNKENGFA